MLNIEPVHDEAWSCLEDLLISTAVWWKRDYELMFVTAWDFNFTDNSNKTLGECLHEGDDNTWKLISEYHGINLTKQNGISAEEALLMFREQLNNNNPVIIFIDAFNCPWTLVYHKSHFPHTCLIIGNAEDNTLYCIDPYTTKNIECLIKSDFLEGYTEFATLKKNECTIKRPVCKDIFKSASNRLLEKKSMIDKNAIEMMEQLAYRIEYSLEIEKETEGHTDLLKSLLYERLKFISRRRSQFSQMLKYLQKKNEFSNLSEVISEFENISQTWSLIRKLLIKYYYIQENKALLKKVANYIRDVAKIEEQLAYRLLSL